MTEHRVRALVARAVSAALCAPGPPTRLLAGLAAVGHAVVLAAWLVLVRSEAQGVGLDAVATAGAAWSTGWALAALVATLRPHGTDDTTSADRVHA